MIFFFKLGSKAFHIHIDSYHLYFLIVWSTDFILILHINVLREADIFPETNNTALLRLLFSKIKRKSNDLEYVEEEAKLVMTFACLSFTYSLMEKFSLDF